MEKIILNGITWGHSRGITPLLAGAQRFNELNPSVEVIWKKGHCRNLRIFPIEKLVEKYDLLIIDHPWVGTAAYTQCVLPLDRFLEPGYLKDQERFSTGGSHESYQYQGNQWALAIDAATPVASYRRDIFEKANIEVPRTWSELLSLAEKGKVLVPGIPVDLLMYFYMFCLAVGEQPFQNELTVVSFEKGSEALNAMKELWGRCDQSVFGLNPIAVAEIMTSGDQYWYCPFAYGYSNYSRTGYAEQLLHYTDMVNFKDQRPLQSTLGGTGIAISATTKYRAEALNFVRWINSSSIQLGLYAQHGGQPGHRRAWKDDDLNQISNNYFKNTLPALDRAFIRPRYHGYLHFQDHAGSFVQQYLLGTLDEQEALNEINKIYHASLKIRDAAIISSGHE